MPDLQQIQGPTYSNPTAGIDPEKQEFATQVKPFEPIDEVASATKAYSLASEVGKVQAQQEKQRDGAALREYIKTGGNLDTPEGIAKAISDLKGKISMDAYSKLMEYRTNAEDHQSKLIQNAPKDLEARLEYTKNIYSGPYQAYEAALAKAKESKDPDPESTALAAFNAAKTANKAMIQQGGPAGVSPQVLKDYEEATPAFAKSQVESSEHFQKLLANKAKTMELEAKAEKERAQAQGGNAPAEVREIAALRAIINDPKKSAEEKADAKALLAKKTAPTATMVNISGINAGTAPKSTEDMYKIAGKYNMTPEAFEKAVDNYNQGLGFPPMGRGVKASPLYSAIMSRAAEKNPEANIGGNKAIMTADTAALKNLTNRRVAVEQITGALAPVETQMTDLAKKVNTRIGGEMGNMIVNEAISKLGNDERAKDVQTLRTLAQTYAREYIKAVTAAGSNAQMHAVHRQDAEALLNGNMPINKMLGAIQGIKADIAAFQKSMQDEGDKLKSEMGTLGKPTTKESNAKYPEAKNAKGDVLIFKDGKWQPKI